MSQEYENNNNIEENNSNKENRNTSDSNPYNVNSENTNSEGLFHATTNGQDSYFENETVPNYYFWAEQAANTQPQRYTQPGDVIYPNVTDYQNDIASTYIQEPQDGNKKKPTKKKPGLVKRLIRLVGAAAIFGVVAAVSFQGVNSLIEDKQSTVNQEEVANADQKDNKTNITSGTDNTDTTVVTPTSSDQSTEVEDVVVDVMPSIVAITSTINQPITDWSGQTYEEEAQGSGSGIILQKDATELLVITNNHVVEGAESISVTFIDETIVEATVKGTDSTADLAVLAIKLSDIKAETLEQIQVATLGDSDKVKVGQRAIAIGNALGYGQSVTVGYVSAKDRSVQLEDKTMVLLQTDAAINPGNSGGALLNIKGEVIGINSVKYASSDVEGMGYAIPISSAIPIINDLMKREVISEEEKGYLGISGQNVSQVEATSFNMPVGVFVNEVSEDGAAKAAGLQANDIITAINDIEVSNIEALAERVNSYRIGTEITLTIMRRVDSEYTETEIKVVLKGAKTLENLDLQEETTNEQDPAQQNPQETPNATDPAQ